MATSISLSAKDQEKLDKWREENPLRQFRKNKGWSHEDVAVKLGVSWSLIQVWEYGIVFGAAGNREFFPASKHFRAFLELKWPVKFEDWHKWFKAMPKLTIK